MSVNARLSKVGTFKCPTCDGDVEVSCLPPMDGTLQCGHCQTVSNVSIMHFVGWRMVGIDLLEAINTEISTESNVVVQINMKVALFRSKFNVNPNEIKIGLGYQQRRDLNQFAIYECPYGNSGPKFGEYDVYWIDSPSAILVGI